LIINPYGKINIFFLFFFCNLIKNKFNHNKKEMTRVFLTANKIGPMGQDDQLLTRPKVITISNTDLEQIIKKNSSPFGCVLKSGLGGRGARKEFWLAESPSQVAVAEDPATANVNAQDKALGLAALGAAQGAGVDVSRYLNEVTTATATTADSVDLPAATVGKVLVLLNNTDVPLEVYPAVGEIIGDLAANALYLLAARERVHFVCRVAGTWLVATGTNGE